MSWPVTAYLSKKLKTRKTPLSWSFFMINKNGHKTQDARRKTQDARQNTNGHKTQDARQWFMLIAARNL